MIAIHIKDKYDLEKLSSDILYLSAIIIQPWVIYHAQNAGIYNVPKVLLKDQVKTFYVKGLSKNTLCKALYTVSHYYSDTLILK